MAPVHGWKLMLILGGGFSRGFQLKIPHVVSSCILGFPSMVAVLFEGAFQEEWAEAFGLIITCPWKSKTFY